MTRSPCGPKKKPGTPCACGLPSIIGGQCGACIFGDKLEVVSVLLALNDKVWKDRVKAILGRLHSVREIRPCHKCGRDLAIILNKNGRLEPITDELKSHWADCPHAEEFRARKAT